MTSTAGSMLTGEDQPDLFSEITDFDLIRYLLADLHDDLAGKIARFRQLVALCGALGSQGTMLSGGETTYTAWHEAQWSFIHGNFTATVMLCQGLAEHLLASFLQEGLSGQDLPERISFAETLARCEKRNLIGGRDVADLRQLMK